MRYLIAFLMVYGLFGVHESTYIAASETNKKNNIILIRTDNIDLNNDGSKEKIELKGILFSQDTKYYRDIWAEITDASGKVQKINYGGGYDTKIDYVDLNHDGAPDLLYKSATGGSGGLYTNRLHTVVSGEITEIPLPEQLSIKGTFKDNFIVEINISPTDNPIIINVENNKDDYIRLGIYDASGRLLTKTDVIIDPIAFFEPVLLDNNKYALKSFQQINGAYRADQLGVVETIWFYEDGDWIILETNWVSKR